MREPFLNSLRLLKGPWQAFERDVARLLVCNGFEDVRLVGGTGDHGADVLGVKDGKLWVIQCKFTTGGYPPGKAVDEIGEAARFYKADRIYVASSRRAGPATFNAMRRWKALGIEIGVLEPAVLLELARKSPEYPSFRRELRDYQEDAAEKFVGSLRETGRAQVVLATGLGKTVVLAESVAQLFRDEAVRSGRALVLAGTRELVDQLQRAFWDELPKWIATHRLVGGELPSFWDGITFATVQSAVSHLDELPHFGLVLIDEAHHVGSETFRRVTGHLADAMIGGVTATPWRGDGYDIDELLGPPVVKIGIAEGLKRGFLCEADYRLLADNIDWELVRSQSRNHYSINQLNRLLLLPTRDDEAARTVRSIFDAERRRSVIVFCSSVQHAHSFAATLRLFGLRTEPITGEMTPRERDRTMAAFRKGSLDIVTTRDLFNEGVDVPDVDMIVFMRVTHSRRIFVQQLGRGLRVSPNKTKVVVLDFVSDLRRIAEVIELEKAARGDLERLRLPGVIHFRDQGAGSFMLDWMRDQADLFMREGDPTLELPGVRFSEASPAGRRPMIVPEEIRDGIRDKLWSTAAELGWSSLSDAERSRYYEQWTRDQTIGGQLAHFMDPRKVRVYIKDSLLKPYERARLLQTGDEVWRLIDVEQPASFAGTFIKPHGRRLHDGRVVCWGKSRDWKLILMSAFERGRATAEASAFAVVLVETGPTADKHRRALVSDAAACLGIAKLAWAE